MTSTPSFITKNRLGIYYFQLTIPSIISRKTSAPVFSKLLRKSLGTRNRREALRKSRILWVMMDKIINQYFEDSDSFGRAMKLLKEWNSVADFTKEQLDDFLCDFTEYDEDLLRSAKRMQQDLKDSDNQKNNDLTLLKQVVSALNNQPTATNLPKIFSAEENPLLTELIDKWLSVKKPSLAISSFESIRQRIHIFLRITTEIVGHSPNILEVNERIIREYKNVLGKIPAHRNKKNLIGKTFTSLSKLNLTPISLKTFKDNTSVAAEFIYWACEESYPFTANIIRILRNVRKSTPKDKIKYIPFDDTDLINIFNSKKYIKGNFRSPSEYWVPLIALFTGARQGEICQLLTTDIFLEDGYWVIDVTIEGSDDKQLKNLTGSKRRFPIHKQLIKLGFLDFHTKIKNEELSKLFPDEPRNRNGKFDRYQKSFALLIKQVGIKKTLVEMERKSFHSFRHTIRTKLAEASISDGIIDGIIGHTSKGRSAGELIYTHTERMSLKADLLAKLEYQKIDFKIIKPWYKCVYKLYDSKLKNK